MLRLRLCFCELRTNFCRLEAENGDFGPNFERVKLPEMPIFCPQEMAFFFICESLFSFFFRNQTLNSMFLVGCQPFIQFISI